MSSPYPILLLLGLVASCAAIVANDCRNEFTSKLISAGDQAARCKFIDEFDECLSRATDTTAVDWQQATTARTSNSCKDNSKVGPRITSRGDSVGVEADDLTVTRLKRSTISVVQLSNDLDNLAKRVDAQDVNFDKSLAAAYNMSAIALSNLVDSAVSMSHETSATVDILKGTMDSRLSAVENEVKNSVLQLEKDVTKAIEDAQDEMAGQVEKVTETEAKMKKDMEGLEKDVSDALSKLNSAVTCNMQGTLDDNDKCKCNEGYEGDKCENKVVSSCYDAPKKGRYTITTGGKKRRIFCDPETYNGGWQLVFNLETGLQPTMHFEAPWWTETGKTLNDDSDESVDNALRTDFKSSIFNDKSDFKEVMLVAHSDGTYLAYNVYDTVDAVRSKTMSALFRSGQTLFTKARKYHWGNLENKMLWNTARPQPLRGDALMDYPNPLIINRASGWGAARNFNRLASTLTNNHYGHTFAGIGGWHEHGLGSYRTKYEAAPITSYCESRVAYGNWNVFTDGAAYCIRNSGSFDGFAWHNVDFAFFVR